jgi:hypothetical protein
VKFVFHFDVPPTSQRRAGSGVLAALPSFTRQHHVEPEKVTFSLIQPNFNSVKCDSLYHHQSLLHMSRDPALQKAHLVFLIRARRVGGRMHDTKMIVYHSFIDCCRGLRNQLSSQHIAIPFRSAVDGELQPHIVLCCWVFV